jgi:hypothetical protein
MELFSGFGDAVLQQQQPADLPEKKQVESGGAV